MALEKGAFVKSMQQSYVTKAPSFFQSSKNGNPRVANIAEREELGKNPIKLFMNFGFTPELHM